jgi:probable rRNA maturation factor
MIVKNGCGIILPRLENMEIEMTFTNETNEETYDEEYFTHIAEVIFEHLHLDDYFIVELNLVSLEKIHEINRDYRNVDRPTDVISFAFEDDEKEAEIVREAGMPRDLGEIFICVDRAKEQAKEYGHSYQREISFLFTHGILHLLGYDHMEPEDEKVMFGIQDELMDKLGLKRGE